MGFCSTVKNIASDLIVIAASAVLVVVTANFAKGMYNQYQKTHDGKPFAFSQVKFFNKAKEKIENAGGSCYDFFHEDVSPVVKGIGRNIRDFGRNIKRRLTQ